MNYGLRLCAVLMLLGMLGFAPPARAAEPICFDEVPDCIEGRFAEFWQANGALAVFGLPLGPAQRVSVSGSVYLAQLFERNRFELHPENAAPYDVLLGRLGDERLRQLGREWQSLPKGQPRDGCQYFDASGHTLCAPFLSYWGAHGLEFDGLDGISPAEALALFGLPLSEPQQETNSSGDTVLTQWFERARLEFHPQNQEEYRVQMGRLGAESQASDPCSGIPASVNASVSPACFQAGAQVTARATGFDPHEQVSYTVQPPSGVEIPALLLSGARTADANGVVEFTGTFPEGTPAGLYSIRFRGASSGRAGLIYFKLID